MNTGVDLVLLAIDDKHGTVVNQRLVALGLAAAELVELALGGCVVLDGVHLVAVQGVEPPRDDLLRASLADLASIQRPTTVSDWISATWAHAVGGRYLAALEQSGTISIDAPPHGTRSAAPRLRITDHERAAAAVERFRAVAHGADTGAATGGPGAAGLPTEVFAALADAAGLTDVRLSGRANKRARERLAELATARTAGVPEPDRTARTITRSAVRAMKELAARPSTGTGFGLGPISVDQQYPLKNVDTIIGYANPNVP